jgi:hypothetical protein
VSIRPSEIAQSTLMVMCPAPYYPRPLDMHVRAASSVDCRRQPALTKNPGPSGSALRPISGGRAAGAGMHALEVGGHLTGRF